MSSGSLRKLTGWAGIITGVALALSFVLDFSLIASTGGPPQIFLDHLSADLLRAKGSGVWVFDTWIYVFQTVPLIVFVVGVRSAIAEAGHRLLADVGAVCLLISQGVLHAIHNVLLITVLTQLVPNYVPGSADAPAIETTARAFLGFAYTVFEPGSGIGSPIMVVGLMAFALAQRSLGARYTWPLAAGSAALMLLGTLQVVFFPIFFAALLGWALYIAWAIVAGVGLVRQREVAPLVAAVQVA